jgi:hypothetical protein
MAQETSDEIGPTTRVSSHCCNLCEIQGPCRTFFRLDSVGGNRLSGQETGRAAVVESRSHGRRAFGLANCLSVVFHLVDPVLVFLSKRAWLLMSVTSVLGYTPPIADGAGEPFTNSLLMLSLEYGPVYLWLVFYCWAARGKRRSAGTDDVEAAATGVQLYAAE